MVLDSSQEYESILKSNEPSHEQDEAVFADPRGPEFGVRAILFSDRKCKFLWLLQSIYEKAK
jgi:hypothetical protein